MEPKRFYRSRTDRKIGGVAAGLGEYFEMDPMLIRLIFVVLLFAGGGGFLIYLILWIVTPEKPIQMSSGNAQPSADPGSYSQPAQEPAASAAQTTPPSVTPPRRQRGSLVGGLVLITLGVLFLADEFFPNFDFGDLWPVIIIVIGVGLLINAFTHKKQ
jgi:phage shock protein C